MPFERSFETGRISVMKGSRRVIVKFHYLFNPVIISGLIAGTVIFYKFAEKMEWVRHSTIFRSTFGGIISFRNKKFKYV